MRTSELSGAALDWAVALADGYDEGWLRRQAANTNPATRAIPHYSTSWDDGGPIIERERITLLYSDEAGRVAEWLAMAGRGPQWWPGPSPLIAAMRCYIASKLGYTVDIPDELKGL